MSSSMEDLFNGNFDLSTSLTPKSSFSSSGIMNYIKDNMVLIIVMVIMICAFYSLGIINTSITFSKILKNNFVKIIIVALLLYYTYKRWHSDKVSVILLFIIVCALYYVVNDNIKSTENFTQYLQLNNLNDPSFKTIPNFTLNSQDPYHTVGCTHIEPDGECNENDESLVDMIDGSPQMDELDGYNSGLGLIGADLNEDGNDGDLQTKMITFGKRFYTDDMNMMRPLNSNNFAKENARETLIQNRGKVDKIFDARDFTDKTDNGFKKMNGEMRSVCEGPLCARPDVMMNSI